MEAEDPRPEPKLRDDLPTDLTDLELFKRYCVPFIRDHSWEHVSWLDVFFMKRIHEESTLVCVANI